MVLKSVADAAQMSVWMDAPNCVAVTTWLRGEGLGAWEEVRAPKSAVHNLMHHNLVLIVDTT